MAKNTSEELRQWAHAQTNMPLNTTGGLETAARDLAQRCQFVGWALGFAAAIGYLETIGCIVSGFTGPQLVNHCKKTAESAIAEALRKLDGS